MVCHFYVLPIHMFSRSASCLCLCHCHFADLSPLLSYLPKDMTKLGCARGYGSLFDCFFLLFNMYMLVFIVVCIAPTPFSFFGCALGAPSVHFRTHGGGFALLFFFMFLCYKVKSVATKVSLFFFFSINSKTKTNTITHTLTSNAASQQRKKCSAFASTTPGRKPLSLR